MMIQNQKQMTFNSWQENKENLFEVMNGISELPFLLEHSTDDLELVFKVTQGDRVLNVAYQQLSVSEVAQILLMRYLTKWNQITELFELEYPVDTNSMVTETETILDDGLQIQTDEVINKESAFNDDEFVNLDSRSDSSNRDTENNRSRTFEQSRKSLQAIMLRKSILEKDVLLDVIFKDIANEITLSIY